MLFTASYASVRRYRRTRMASYCESIHVPEVKGNCLGVWHRPHGACNDSMYGEFLALFHYHSLHQIDESDNLYNRPLIKTPQAREKKHPKTVDSLSLGTASSPQSGGLRLPLPSLRQPVITTTVYQPFRAIMFTDIDNNRSRGF